MKDFDMIKAFAELDGVKVEHSNIEDCNEDFPVTFYTLKSNGYEHEEYNPITDLALNCAARDEYRVTVDYEWRVAFIDGVDSSTAFSGEEYVCMAVIECILKSKGLYINNVTTITE